MTFVFKSGKLKGDIQNGKGYISEVSEDAVTVEAPEGYPYALFCHELREDRKPIMNLATCPQEALEKCQDYIKRNDLGVTITKTIPCSQLKLFDYVDRCPVAQKEFLKCVAPSWRMNRGIFFFANDKPNHRN